MPVFAYHMSRARPNPESRSKTEQEASIVQDRVREECAGPAAAAARGRVTSDNTPGMGASCCVWGVSACYPCAGCHERPEEEPAKGSRER